MYQLELLEKRIQEIEKEKIDLLLIEQKSTTHLTYEANVLGEKLAEIEAMADQRARKRELTLTKLYSRLNGKIRNDIYSNEGNLKTVQRKRTAYGEKNSEMLFDGIRD